MKTTQPKQVGELFKKTTKNIKDFIPPNLPQINIRETKAVVFPESLPISCDSFIKPNTPFPEWPLPETVSSFDFGLKSNTQFNDENNNTIIFPYSLRHETGLDIVWETPKEIQFQMQLRKSLADKFSTKSITDIQKKINYCNKKAQLLRRNSVGALQASEINDYFNSLLSPPEKEIVDNIQQNYQQSLSIVNTITSKEGVDIMKPSSINMSKYYCKYCKWLASLFQAALDNKVNNYGFIQSIYPQNEEKIPIYNPSGRYWVKLFHMGKYRKIEIDDKIPCDRNTYEIFFPQCEKFSELWPLLLTKALLKLYSYKYRNDKYESEEIGDWSLFYSLTGYLGYDIPMNSINSDFLNKVLTEDNYVNKDWLILAFCPSTKEETKQEKVIFKYEQSKVTLFRKGIKRPSTNFISSSVMLPSLGYNSNISNNMSEKYGLPSLRKIPLHFGGSSGNIIKIKTNNKQENGIYYDIAYSVIETFNNVNFNMKRLKKIEFSDWKLNYTEYMDQLRELRRKQREEKDIRINEYKSPGTAMTLIKILNGSIDKYDDKPHYLTNIETVFNCEQVEMAKFCCVNKWKFPLPEFFEKTFWDHIHKDDESGEINFWTRHFYMKLIKNEKDKEMKHKKALKSQEIKEENQGEQDDEEEEVKDESVVEYVQPVKRVEGAWWVSNIFYKSFKKFIMLKRMDGFKNKWWIDNIWYNYERDWYEEKVSSQIVRLFPLAKETPSESSNINDVNAQWLIVFEPNLEKSKKSVSSCLIDHVDSNSEKTAKNQFDDINCSVIIQIYKVAENKTVHRISDKNITVLKDLFNIFENNSLSSQDEYLLMIKGGINPFGYTLQLLSNSHQFQSYSYAQYLLDFKNYHNNEIHIAHPVLSENRYYLIAKLQLVYNPWDKDSAAVKAFKFYSTINNYEDKSIREYIDITLIHSVTNRKKRIYEKEIFSINFESCSKYFIEISIIPSYNIPERVFRFDLLTEFSHVKVEKMDMIPPFFINELYLPNKHAILFNELLYPSDYVVVTLDISVQYKPHVAMEEEEEEAANETGKIHGQGDHDGKSENNKNINLKLLFEYSKGDNMIFSKTFVNTTLIRNLIMEGKQYNPKAQDNEIVPYKIKCYLDITELPSEFASHTEYKNDLFWNVGVFSTDSLLFCKNTSKEDKEKAVIENWEKAQPGRKDLAKKSRKKYFISKKHSSGVELTSEEADILGLRKEGIESTSTMILTNIPPSWANAGINNNSKESVNFNKKNLPTINSYSSLFMKNFFCYSTNDRIIVINKSKNRERNQSLPNIQYCKSIEEREKEKRQITEIYDSYMRERNEVAKSNIEKQNNYENEINEINNKFITEREDNRCKRIDQFTKQWAEINAKTQLINEKYSNWEYIINEINAEGEKAAFDSWYYMFKDNKDISSLNWKYKNLWNLCVEKWTLWKEKNINNDWKLGNKLKKETITKHLSQINENLLNVDTDLIEKLMKM